MPPAAPTSAPATISTGLLITKPAIAAAVPVNELSSEITTGMSAPPIGSTIATPNVSAAATMTSRTTFLTVRVEDERSAVGAEDEQQQTEHGHRCERERGDPTARNRDRLAADPAHELARRDERARERDRPDGRAEDDEDRRRNGFLERSLDADVVVDRDERRRATADGVEERHQLRHRRHLHGPGEVPADATADGPADPDDQDRLDAHDAQREEPHDRRDDRDCHPGGAQAVALARRRRRIHLVEADHEAGRADHPGEKDEGVHPLR